MPQPVTAPDAAGSSRFLHNQGLASSADPLERLQDLWILGLETAVDGYIFRRVFAEKDQRVAYVVGIVDRGCDFLDHLFLRFRLMPGGASINTTGIEFLLSLIHGPSVGLTSPILSGTILCISTSAAGSTLEWETAFFSPASSGISRETLNKNQVQIENNAIR